MAHPSPAAQESRGKRYAGIPTDTAEPVPQQTATAWADTGSEPSAEEEALAIAHVAIAASVVDGDPERILLEDLCETLRSIPHLEGLDVCGAAQYVDALHEGDGLPEVIREPEKWFAHLARSLRDTSLRRIAFQLAYYACAWDGTVSAGGERALAAIADVFAIASDEAQLLRDDVRLAMEENAWPSRASRERWSVV